MPTHIPIHDIARRLRHCAEELEREIAKHAPTARVPIDVGEAEQRREAVHHWGVLAGELLDDAFGQGALHWDHYAAMKAETRAHGSSVDDWHYRLFLATTSNIAASDPETGGVRVPGFLCEQCADWGNPHVTPCRTGAPECGEAIRRVAGLIEGAV